MFSKKIFTLTLIMLCMAVPVLFITSNMGLIFLAKFIILASLAVPMMIYILEKAFGFTRAKAIIINVVVLSITTIVCLLIAEIFVRHLFEDISTTGDNSSYFAQRWKINTSPAINQYGFREKFISRQKDPGVYRVAIVGDSFTYGQGISEGDRFSAIIERRLNSTSKQYEVLNFGKPGAETIDHIRFLDDVFEVDPDFILLQWFSNDVEGHDKHERPKPYRLIPSDYLSGWLHRNSALFYLLGSKWNQLQGHIGLIETYEDSMLRRFSDPYSADSRRADRELNEFITLINNRNIQAGIVMFPNLVDVGGIVDNYPYGFLFDRVNDTCLHHGIQCLDLRPVFSRESPASELWVNQFDAHPGPVANELAAEAILNTFGDRWKSEASHLP